MNTIKYAPFTGSAQERTLRSVEITTPCVVCATHARVKHSPFFATRGHGWPVTQIAGHRVHKACASEAEFLAGAVENGELLIDGSGVGRWGPSGQVVPADCAALLVALRLAPGLDEAATADARQAQTRAFIEEYRAAQPAEPSAEELSEMRAAFGRGARVVNVITDRETQL